MARWLSGVSEGAAPSLDVTDPAVDATTRLDLVEAAPPSAEAEHELGAREWLDWVGTAAALRQYRSCRIVVVLRADTLQRTGDAAIEHAVDACRRLARLLEAWPANLPSVAFVFSRAAAAKPHRSAASKLVAALMALRRSSSLAPYLPIADRMVQQLRAHGDALLVRPLDRAAAAECSRLIGALPALGGGGVRLGLPPPMLAALSRALPRRPPTAAAVEVADALDELQALHLATRLGELDDEYRRSYSTH